MIRYEPSAIIWHKESASAGGHDAPQYVYYQLRNYFLFHGHWAKNIRQLMMSVGFVLLYAGKRIFRFVIQGKWRSLMGIIYGIRDAIIGRWGRREYKILMQQSTES
jgi:GT2 family glycosyltransferase